MSTIGFVKKINSKSGTAKTGKPYTLSSMKLSDKDGNELPGWYQFGFDAPTCKEGDYVKLEATPKGNNWEIVKGSVKVSKNPPAAPRQERQEAGASGGSSKDYGQTQKNIHYQNSRTAAIEVVGLLLDNDALPMSAAKSKAGQAARFDEIIASVNKLTVQYFNDLESFRLFDTVADAGVVDTSGDGDLPDADEEPEEEDGFESDIPFDVEEDDDGFE